MLSDHPLRRTAQILGWVGLLALAGGVALLALRIQPVGGLLLAGGLIGLGLNAALGREMVLGGEPRSFTVRGPVVRGEVEVRAAFNNLTVGACPNDRTATMRYGPLGGPGFEVKDGVARLELKASLLRPNFTHWQADLAGNVLWDVAARSFAGDLLFDLTHLRLNRLDARTALGHVRLHLPQRGYVEMNVQTGLGRVEVSVPPETGVRIVIRRQELASLTIENERLKMVAADRYTTPHYDESPGQVDLRITTGVGDIVIW